MSQDLDISKSKRIYWASGIVSICGIIFEVLFGALGSYVFGDGVKQYTLTISLFLTGMGIGAYISERVLRGLIRTFVWVEFAVALVGGFSAFLLFGIQAYVSVASAAFYLYFVILLVGALTGLELPILIRKANEIGVEMKRSTARVLFSDYAGGLIGGLLFVFLLRPEFGLVKTAFIVATVNAVVALWVVWRFRDELLHWRRHVTAGMVIVILLGLGILFGEATAFSFEQKLYKDPIVYEEDSQYQRITLTLEQGDLRLYLNGQLQFSSSDEYRYHETLVDTPMSLAGSRSNVLILGGGDGLALREVLKYSEVRQVTLVDLDPRVIRLAKTYPLLTELNRRSFYNPKVQVINTDAFKYMEQSDRLYDVILVDLPDPGNESLNKLYTWEFYSLLKNHLAAGGKIMVQATSPVFATAVYWTIDKTIRETGLMTENLHVNIPSFGNWGFVLASRDPIDLNKFEMKVDSRFLTKSLLLSMTQFGKDEDSVILENGKPVELQVNTLIHPNLLSLYQKAWQHY